MSSPIFSKSDKRQRLVKVIGIGSARMIAIGRIAPEVRVGDLLLAVYYPKSNKIELTPYEAEETTFIKLQKNRVETLRAEALERKRKK